MSGLFSRYLGAAVLVEESNDFIDNLVNKLHLVIQINVTRTIDLVKLFL
ncbi:MAG: hypothetical protein F6K21_16895 [Symploca sp. SIO2D2]|nr:hypothetical protein [Symploca sp. SIO2D2]